MKLYLKNHAERYPVEQLQLQLFAQEPSEFCAEPFTGDGTVSSLSLIHISEPTRLVHSSRMPSSA